MPVTDQEPPPPMPEEPAAGACCQSGCDPCVYDLYWAAVDRYEQALADWKNRHRLDDEASPAPTRHDA